MSRYELDKITVFRKRVLVKMSFSLWLPNRFSMAILSLTYNSRRNQSYKNP